LSRCVWDVHWQEGDPPRQAGDPVRTWHEERGATVKPELTFRRSLRLIAKRWWLLLLCGVLLAAAAFAIVGMKETQYALYTDLSIKDYSLSPKTGTPGFLLQPANPNFPDQWVPDDFVNSQAAITTSRNLGGEPTPDQILAGLTMGGLTNSTVRLSYTGTGSASQAFNVLKQYTTVLLNQRADK